MEEGMLKILGKRVAIRKVKEEKKIGILITPDEKVSWSILSVGPDATKVAVGDKVYINHYQTIEVDHDGEKIYLMDEDNILAIIS